MRFSGFPGGYAFLTFFYLFAKDADMDYLETHGNEAKGKNGKFQMAKLERFEMNNRAEAYYPKYLNFTGMLTAQKSNKRNSLQFGISLMANERGISQRGLDTMNALGVTSNRQNFTKTLPKFLEDYDKLIKDLLLTWW